MKNKLQIVWSSIAIISVCACSTPYTQPDAPIKEVPFTQVHLDDNFWSPRIETNRTVSIPSAFKECEKNGRFDNFAIAGGLMKGEHRGDFSFDDTDPYKIIEGASYSLAVKYDGKLDHYLDSVIHIIATAQEPDGYLTTCVTNQCTRLSGWWGTHRWEKINSHELYNSGHLYEPPLLIIAPPENVHYWMWLSKMPIWYVRSSDPAKGRSIVPAVILSPRWLLSNYIR